jgi:hypothetical protein
MGYDLSVRFPSKKIRDEMQAFVGSQSEAFKDLARAMGYEDGDTAPDPGESLGAYIKASRSRRMGYHVSRSQDWNWAILVWLAQKAGDRDKEGRASVWYDEERWPLLPPGSLKQDGLSVDGQGRFIFRASPMAALMAAAGAKDIQPDVVRLLDCLEGAWCAREAASLASQLKTPKATIRLPRL